MRSPESRAHDLGFDLLTKFRTLAASIVSLLGALFGATTAPPENLFVRENLLVDEVRRSTSNVVDLGAETGNRRHVDRHNSLLGSACFLLSITGSSPVPRRRVE